MSHITTNRFSPELESGDDSDEPDDEPEVLPTQGACSIRKAE